MGNKKVNKLLGYYIGVATIIKNHDETKTMIGLRNKFTGLKYEIENLRISFFNKDISVSNFLTKNVFEETQDYLLEIERKTKPIYNKFFSAVENINSYSKNSSILKCANWHLKQKGSLDSMINEFYFKLSKQFEKKIEFYSFVEKHSKDFFFLKGTTINPDSIRKRIKRYTDKKGL